MKQWVTVAAVVFLTSGGLGAAAPSPPNILLIVADDLGYGDLGSYGHPTIRSPNIDRLAEQGVRFTDFYSAAPVCSPARAALLTGRIPARVGIYDWIPPGSDMHLETSATTVAELLRDAGYATAMFGKWHLNGSLAGPQPQPDDHGFEYWFATAGFARPSHVNPFNFARNGEELGPLEGYACQLVADEAIHWLNDVRDRSRPFFQFVSLHEPHEAIASPPALTASYPATQNREEAEYFANVTNLDAAVGRLLAALDELDLARSTLVIFSSDNGPEMLNRHPQAQRSYGTAGALRGKKLQLWDGGIRVPGIVRWPGEVRAGTVSQVPVSFVDLLPTLCGAAQVDLPAELPLDGVDARPAFAGVALERERPLFWFHYKAWGGPRAAMRRGRWKAVGFWDGPERLRGDSSTMRPGDLALIRSLRLVRFELYDMSQDPGERHDVSAAHPERLQAMRKEMEALLHEVQHEGRDWQESWLRGW